MLNIDLDPKCFKFFLIIAHVFQDYIKADVRGLILMCSLLSKCLEFTTLLSLKLCQLFCKGPRKYTQWNLECART